MTRFRLLIPALVLALAAVGAAAAAASTGTPTLTPEPTPTASPTPYPQSTITVRFVRDGEPVEVRLVQPFSSLRADGALCVLPVPATEVITSTHIRTWPLREHGLAEECLKPPPTIVEFTFRMAEVGHLINATVLWLGDDAVVDVEVPHFATDLPTPTLEPTPTTSPTPHPQSTITVRFVRDGEPVEIWLATSPVRRVLADGVQCDIAIRQSVDLSGGYSLTWPRGPLSAAECTKGPPTTITIEFTAHVPEQSPFPILATTVDWTGQDVSVDLEIPPSVPVLNPSAIPTPSLPAAFPATGGAPAKALPHADLILLALGALILFAAAGVASWHSKQ